MKGISCVIIFTSCISVTKTQDINLDGAVSDKVELTLEERSWENNFHTIRYIELLWQELSCQFSSEHRDRLQRRCWGCGRGYLRDKGGGARGPRAGHGGAVHAAGRDAVLQHLRHQVSRHRHWNMILHYKPSIKHLKQYLRCDADCLTFPRYSNAKQEKCEDVFVKTCRIVQRPKTYNHTVRLCRRPLVKKCHEYQESVSVGSHATWQHDWDDTFHVSAPRVRGRVCCSPPTWIRRPAPQLRPVRRPPAPRLSRPGAGQCGVQGHVRDSLQHIHTREQETEIGIDRHINWILLYSFTIHQK